MTLTELAQSFVGQRLTIIHEYYGNFDDHYRRLRALIVDEINPLITTHGAEPISVDLVPNPDEEDDPEPAETFASIWPR